MHALHVVRAVLAFLSVSSHQTWISIAKTLTAAHRARQQRTELDSSAQSSTGPLYYEEFLDLASLPRAKILRKYAHYSIIIVNTDGAAAIQRLISSPSGAWSYQGQPSPCISNGTHGLQQSSRDINVTTP